MLGNEAAITGDKGRTATMGLGESSKTESSTPAVETKTEVTSKPESSAPAVGVPSWEPNYKFKVMDKEHEVDEWIRPVIKDAEIEKKVKEIYTKAHGIDSIKEERESYRTRFSETNDELSRLKGEIGNLGEYIKNDDLDSFFEQTGIPKEKILRYALKQVELENMPPEQKAQWESSRQAQSQLRYFQQQNAQLQASQQQFHVQQRSFELDNAISSSDAKAVAEAYNNGMNDQSAFRNYCIQIGQAYVAQGQDISVQQAVGEALRHLRAVNPGLGISQQQSQVVTASQKPVIPNIQGRGTSAVKSTPRTLDEIKQKARELANSTY